MSNQPITTGAIQNPYREFTFVLAVNEVLPVYFDFDYFRVLTLTAATLQVRFGGSGSFTDFIDAGVGVEIPEIINQCTLKNSGGVPITVTIALAVGKISDDRLAVSASIDISKATTFTSVADLAIVAAAAAVVIQATATSTRDVIITNTGANPCRIGDAGTGAAEGTLLAVNQTLIISATADIYCYSTLGCTLTRSYTGD